MIRIILCEKGLNVRLVETMPWEEDATLAACNPAATIPVLVDRAPTGADISISPASAITEYLEEAYSNQALLPSTSAARAETRRLCCWFGEKFEREVTSPLLRERIEKPLKGNGRADYEILKQGADGLSWHMDYLAWLLDQRKWLAGERFSTADIAAAAHLSSLDYLGVVSWDEFPDVKEWYARIKSRPSMRPILKDRLNGHMPSNHYDDPDF